jgi:heme exporter protein A
VSFALQAGECLHVLGANGSGKSTLLRLLAGLLTPEQGQVSWGGRDTRADRDAWCASFSYLAHSDGQKPELTTHENLAFDAGMRRRLGVGEAEDALRQVGLDDLHDLPAGFLSAGQRRRLAIARVVLSAAPLWILDEPYTNLDDAGSALVSGIIGRHLDAGGAAICAAHQPPAIPGHDPLRLELS